MSLGFGGRVFLTEAEHQTYLRRMPVRYVKHRKSALCCVCGLPGTTKNPLENAHLIPFNVGVKLFKLTPDYLDTAENIVTAHKSRCNKACELDTVQVADRVGSLRRLEDQISTSFPAST